MLETYRAADDLVLCLSELATNAVRYSTSAAPGGSFRVSVEIAAGLGVRLKVGDDGGPWQKPSGEFGERMHGLDIVRVLATGVSIDGDAATGWIVSACFAWPLGAERGDGTA